MPRELNNLNIVGVRGATKPVDIPFNGNKGMSLIFGENGTGKTSIVDALDIVCNKKFGIVETMSGARHSHVPSVGCSGSASSVILSLSDGSNYSASFRGRAIEVDPPSGCPKAFILRRKTLLDFIEKVPSDRFSALRVFIDTSNLDSAEETLRALISSKKRERDGKDQGRKAANKNINQIWTQETDGKGDIRVWVKAIIDEQIKDGVFSVEQLGKILSTIDDLLQKKQEVSESKNIRDTFATAKETASTELQAVLKGSMANAPAIVDLLNNAKSIIQESKQEQCPVCLQSIDPESLLGELSGRITDLQAVLSASQKFKTSEVDLLKKSTALNSAFKTLASKCLAGEKLLAALVEKDVLPEIKNKLGFGDENVPEEFSDAVCSSVADFIDEVAGFKEALLALMQDTPQRLQLQKNLTPLVDSALNAKKEHQVLVDEIEVLDGLRDICETKRKAYVAGELDSISNRVGSLYDSIHPDENIGSPVLRIVPGQRASVELVGKFHSEEGIPPQAYFSESHLDTLGICIFLALSEKYVAEDDIVALDDVLTSVDAEHLQRTLEVYGAVASQFNHLVFTTHYRKIMNLYRFNRVSADVETLVLGNWSLDGGIKIVRAEVEVSLLTELVEESPIDRQAIASKCGILLESIFDYLTFKYGCPIRRKNTGYTLNELLGAILGRSRLCNVLEVDKCTINEAGEVVVAESHSLRSLLREILNVCSVRNDVGCHFKFEAGDITDAEVKGFAEKTLELAGLLICPDNGDFPNKDRSGSYWETKNGLLRLKPLSEPRDN
jgi:hypothetical protein